MAQELLCQLLAAAEIRRRRGIEQPEAPECQLADASPRCASTSARVFKAVSWLKRCVVTLLRGSDS